MGKTFRQEKTRLRSPKRNSKSRTNSESLRLCRDFVIAHVREQNEIDEQDRSDRLFERSLRERLTRLQDYCRDLGIDCDQDNENEDHYELLIQADSALRQRAAEIGIEDQAILTSHQVAQELEHYERLVHDCRLWGIATVGKTRGQLRQQLDAAIYEA